MKLYEFTEDEILKALIHSKDRDIAIMLVNYLVEEFGWESKTFEIIDSKSKIYVISKEDVSISKEI